MTDERTFQAEVLTTGQKLLEYCRRHDWAGYDPYDALNSKWLAAFPILDHRVPRLVLTQALKRSPINLRPLLRIPATRNPKGLALFLSALLKAPQLAGDGAEKLTAALIRELMALRSAESHWAWGYSFAWQTRTIVVPRAFPNLVCTMFVASVFLDLYERSKDAQYLSIAASAAEYMVENLYWTDDTGCASFSYPLPGLKSKTHNANLLAAAFLCRVFKHTQDERLLAPALKAARYSAGKQESDGSWYYGEGASQHWIDNFHTGYNLGALRTISRTLGTAEFDAAIGRGFEFYRRRFFREDGAVRYFHDNTYPIDIHCVAQSIITLLEFQDLDAGSTASVQAVFRWAKDHMWSDGGYFYYRVLRLCTIRTPYMRWSEAWMLLALASILHADVDTPRPLPEMTARA